MIVLCCSPPLGIGRLYDAVFASVNEVVGVAFLSPMLITRYVVFFAVREEVIVEIEFRASYAV